MAVNYNPKVSTDGLVLCLDAANKKSYDNKQNLLPYSENATIDIYGLWAKINVTVPGTTTTAPDGTNTAYLIVPSVVNTNHYIAHINNSVVASTTYTHSVYAKAGGYSFLLLNFATDFTANPNATFNLATGVITSSAACIASISSVGNGWYRCSITATAATTGDGYIYNFPMPSTSGSYAGNGTSGVYLWGVQLEANSSPGEYIKTTGARFLPTTWTDLSGNSNNVTLYNSPTYSTLNGGKLTFNGSYGVTSSTSVLSNTAYTKTAWFRFAGLGSANNIISGNGGDHAFWGGTRSALCAGHNGSYYTVQSTTVLKENTWYFGAVTFNTSTGWRLYLNGKLEAISFDLTTFNGNGNIEIGGFGGAANLMNGDMAIANVYNRVLTPDEIIQNYNAMRGRFGV